MLLFLQREFCSLVKKIQQQKKEKIHIVHHVLQQSFIFRYLTASETVTVEPGLCLAGCCTTIVYFALSCQIFLTVPATEC